MIFFNTYFKDFADFKSKFTTNNGSRHNGIVIAHLKWCFRHRNDRLYKPEIKRAFEAAMNMNDVYEHVLYMMFTVSSCNHNDNPDARMFETNFLGLPNPVWHKTIESDERRGVCEDNDLEQVRFIRHLTLEQMSHTDGVDRAKVVKKKAGRLLREILTDTIADLPESVVNYVCETFANKWRAARVADIPRYELHIDDDFASIYGDGRRKYRIDGSCMSFDCQYKFYSDSVNAHAAYLTDIENDGAIVARCILFDEVFDEDGNKYRYAERQYSQDGDISLKQLLVDKLIAGGHIDLYKEVGASYSDCDRIYRVSDRALLNEEEFRIENTIEDGDTLSFQDTFIFLKDGYAYNKYQSGYDHKLNTCDSILNGEYDDYHDCYCRETFTCYVWDVSYREYNEVHCSVDNDDDFMECIDGEYYDDYVEINGSYYPYDHQDIVNIDGEYYLKDDCRYCEYRGVWLLEEDAVYSDEECDYIHVDDAIEIDGDWYRKSKCKTYDEDEIAIEDGVVYVKY